MPETSAVVIANSNSFGVLPLYSGLRLFCRHSGIKLSFAPWGRTPSILRPGVLAVELHRGDDRPLVLCFDMHDSGDHYFREHLEACDVYFKRSFDARSVAALGPGLAGKVRRYGLFTHFTDRRDTSLPARIWCEFRSRRRGGADIGRKELRWWGVLLASAWAYPLLPRRMSKALVLPETTLVHSTPSLGAGICFQTRVWSPAEAPHERNLTAINAGRAAMVRALRERFGAAFTGGLMRTPYAVEQYPDLLTSQPQDRLSYVELLQRSRVCVVTQGIHGSIPEKVAESLAAGRCIVTEPLQYELPVPLRPGTHCLEFRSPEECVDACERLLTDTAAATAMQAANRAYYAQHASAEATVSRCFAVAQEGRGRAEVLADAARLTAAPRMEEHP